MTFVSKNSHLGKNVSIGPFSVVGLPARSSEGRGSAGRRVRDILPALVGDGTVIGPNVIIEEGVKIGENVIIESGAVIEKGSSIGAGTLIVHGARILADVRIGKKCVISGLISDRCSIGNHSRVFGNLIHRQDNPLLSWDGTIEESPIIDEYVFISFGAQVIGNVRIGDHSYVCANAVVTRDVKPRQIVVGNNRSIPHSKWKGKLRQSNFWKELIK